MVKLAVKQPAPPAEEVSTEVMAESIVAISEGMKKLRGGRLNDKALMLLIQMAAPQVPTGRGKLKTRIGMREIEAVLDGIKALRRTYLRD